MAQREVWQKPVTDPEGNVIEGASVTVFEQNGSTVATIYTSLTGGVKANPFLTGSDGLARFYAEPGRYVVRAQKGSLLAENIDVDLSMKALRDDLPSLALMLTGAQSVVGLKSFTSGITSQGLTVGRGGGGVETTTAVGVGALPNNTSPAGAANTAVGNNALHNNTTGQRNTAVGQQALLGQVSGGANTAIGYRALLKATSFDNVSIGSDSFFNLTTGGHNVAVGAEASYYNIAGQDNVAVGMRALYYNTGSGNTAIGAAAMNGMGGGGNNIAIGLASGGYNSPFSITTQSNRIVMGNSTHTNAYIRVSWTVTSDARDKTDFAPIPLGLDFVESLEPTEYQFRKGERSENGKGDGCRRYGFLAQQVLECEGADPVITDIEDPDNLKLHESYLIPVLVNAIKELSARVKELEK